MPEIHIFTELGALSNELSQFLSLNGPVAILFGAFFLGEIAILLAFILSTQGVFLYETVFLFSILGVLAADIFWYTVGATFYSIQAKNKNQKERFFHKKFALVALSLEKIVGKNIFLSLLFIKFLYGIRLVTLFYLGFRKTPLHLFIPFSMLGTLIFLLVLFAISWGVGQGLYNLMPFLAGIQGILTTLVILLLIVKTFQVALKRYILKK